MPLQKPKYKIIFDTNTLFYGNPIRKDVSSFIKKYNDQNKFILGYYLPEIVLEEFRKNIFEQYREFELTYEKGKKEIETMLGFSLPLKKKSQLSILRKVNKEIKNHGFRIIRTPYKSIQIKKLINSAIWYRPPFFPETKEKGFKDFLIAETIRKIIKEAGDYQIVFVCRDERFRNYCQNEFKNDNFRVYDSIVRLESGMLLNLLKLSKEHQVNLINKADKVFQEMFRKNNILAEIETSFAKDFTNPRSSGLSGLLDEKDWEPTGEMDYSIEKSAFTGNQEAKYTWDSRVIISKRYGRHSSLMYFLNNPPSREPLNEYSQFKFAFNIIWESFVTKEDELKDCTVRKINSPIISKWTEVKPINWSDPLTKALLENT